MIELKMTKVAIITPECFKDNEGILKGLPNWTIFSALMTLISLSLPKMPRQRNIMEDITFQFWALFQVLLCDYRLH